MKRATLATIPALLGAAILLAVPAAAAGDASSSGKTRTASAKPTPPPKMVLPFILDDYAKALQEARARKRPLFIETWAPW